MPLGAGISSAAVYLFRREAGGAGGLVGLPAVLWISRGAFPPDSIAFPPGEMFWEGSYVLPKLPLGVPPSISTLLPAVALSCWKRVASTAMALAVS